MSQPLVSILVPIYGVERYIERCVVSLMEQTYSEIEYIFVDDATPDHSIDILQNVVQQYPQRSSQVRILHHKQNRGLSAARNTAIAAVTGEYLWHVDSDDYIAPNAVELLVSTAQNAKADIVIFDAIKIEEQGEKRLVAEYVDKNSYLKGLLQHLYICAHWNKFYKATFYKGTNIQSVERVRLAEDYAVTPRVIHQAQTLTVLHEPLYYYETRNQNSYVHNLNRTAILSHYMATDVLESYFSKVADKEQWRDVVNILKQRSIASLLKQSKQSSWKDIRTVYAKELCLSSNGLKLVDKMIYTLFKTNQDVLLSIFLWFYRCVYMFAKK